MSTIRCHIHNVDETDQPGDYRACLECAHIFRTEQDLVDAHNEEMRHARERYPGELSVADAVSGDQITACPHCTHDW